MTEFLGNASYIQVVEGKVYFINLVLMLIVITAS